MPAPQGVRSTREQPAPNTRAFGMRIIFVTIVVAIQKIVIVDGIASTVIVLAKMSLFL